ncbi:MAG: PEGA domain-containing protein [Terracidiphilus sp.]
MRNAPSTLRVQAGSHSIRMEHSGFRAWEKSLSVNADDQITLSAVLDPQPAGGKE